MAQESVRAETICWIDSDIIVVAEPTELILKNDEDIVACPVDIKEMGSVGPVIYSNRCGRRFCASMDYQL